MDKDSLNVEIDKVLRRSVIFLLLFRMNPGESYSIDHLTRERVLAAP